MEFEVKLAALPGARLEPAAVLVAAARTGRLLGEPRAVHLLATVFDTPDGLLRAAGWTLRCRTEDGVPVATLKGPGPIVAGIRGRAEHEVSLPAPARSGQPLPPALLRPLSEAGIAVDRWPEALFGTDVRRTVADLDLGDARAELAIDAGEVVAGAGRSPVAEIELELVAGSPAAVVAAARAMARLLQVRPGGRSKAARGMRLLGLLRPPALPPGDAPRAALWEALLELEERRREGEDAWTAEHERLRRALGIAPGPGDAGWVEALWDLLAEVAAQ